MLFRSLLNTQNVTEIFQVSRPTAYNLMGDKSALVEGNRVRRVIPAADVQRIIADREAELLRRLDEEVTQPRARLAELIEKSAQVVPPPA